MSERTIPEPHLDRPILPWYEGAYSHAFLALHPFFTIEDLDLSRCVHGTLILERGDKPDGLTLLEWGDRAEATRSEGKETDAAAVSAAAKGRGRAIGWGAICRDAGFASPRDLNRALRTHIGALRPELADRAGAARLRAHCETTRIFPPTEGEFQPLMEDAIAALLQRAGLCGIVVGDEFGHEEHAVAVSALLGPRPWYAAGAWPPLVHRRLYAADRSLLVCTPWDEFFTLILGTAERLADAPLSELFEGFWCGEETTIDQLLEAPIDLA